MQLGQATVLETKFCRFDSETVNVEQDGTVISGYASLFGQTDHGGDVVARGAYAESLAQIKAAGRAVKLLWQHDPAQPIGIWDEVVEDDQGLYVKGRLLTEVARGREAAALIGAGAIDGLSIGYRTVEAQRNAEGRRVLKRIELWEVSLVTFPMLPEARIGAKGDRPADLALREMAEAVEAARRLLSAG